MIRKTLLTLAAAVSALALGGAPASAQFFWSPPDLSTPPVTGAEPALALNMPGATPEELKAGLVWNMRAALNVAALQCQFEPTLLTLSNYNAMLAHHKAELAKSFDTVGAYFQRTVGKGKPGQTAFDQYGTKIYSAFSTVQAQRNFCEISGSVGRDAIFVDRGKLYEVAQKRMGELRRSLTMAGEQYFGNPGYNFTANLPSLDDTCWKKGKMSSACKAQWDALPPIRKSGS